MLALWREWKLDKILKKAWREGIVLGGVSAGSICWFEEGLTDSVLGKLTALPCLGFLPGSNAPHYDSEPERRPTYLRLIGRGKMLEGFAMDDCIALHFENKRLLRVVRSQADAAAYRVKRVENEAVEERI